MDQLLLLQRTGMFPGEAPVNFRDPGGGIAEIESFVNYVKPRPA